MYLIDTNIWLERLLDQENSEQVGRFLDRTASEHLFITDFSFHSIGIILVRLKQAPALVKFVRDTLLEGMVGLLRLEPSDMVDLVAITKRFNLDYDDAYQYLAADKHHLLLVSFDGDFDRTDRGRKLPEQVM
jgi:uncharacterized protein